MRSSFWDLLVVERPGIVRLFSLTDKAAEKHSFVTATAKYNPGSPRLLRFVEYLNECGVAVSIQGEPNNPGPFRCAN